ncbi:hypothetical protein JOB18_028134 [Solea senegalensis]|uniref:Secreted protein n=1 Tax=Solea senegalensis TaxID=28829 RepID=A0AAV6QVI4_SOLSE|nr:hypothetical protein JOB18_028134 [Solea senegalensis]
MSAVKQDFVVLFCGIIRCCAINTKPQTDFMIVFANETLRLTCVCFRPPTLSPVTITFPHILALCSTHSRSDTSLCVHLKDLDQRECKGARLSR